jgi:hypothetical protein
VLNVQFGENSARVVALQILLNRSRSVIQNLQPMVHSGRKRAVPSMSIAIKRCMC